MFHKFKEGCMAKTNICIIGLTKLFTDEVCKQLSSSLEMFYANIDELLEYELQDKNKIEEICGKEYLVKEELSVIRRACSFDNTIINIDYVNLNNETALTYLKDSCLIIYLKLSKEEFKKEINKDGQTFNQMIISNDLFDDRDLICSTLADIEVEIVDTTMETTLNKINEKILEFYA